MMLFKHFDIVCMHNIIQIHNDVLQDWQYSIEYSIIHAARGEYYT